MQVILAILILIIVAVLLLVKGISNFFSKATVINNNPSQNKDNAPAGVSQNSVGQIKSATVHNTVNKSAASDTIEKQNKAAKLNDEDEIVKISETEMLFKKKS
jgi:hypothetical protein